MTLFFKLHRFMLRLLASGDRARVWSTLKADFAWLWTRFWMRYAGVHPTGRLATRLATWFVPPYYGRKLLAELSPGGYVSPHAVIHHHALRLGTHIFIGDRVTIFEDRGGGPIALNDRTHLYGDSYLQTGQGGSIEIGPDTHVQPRCHLAGYLAPIRIGARVQIGPNCAFFPYDHGIDRGQRIGDQPLTSKGGIVIDDDSWLGTGVTVLSGVRIGKGAVVGAGAVVTKDVPDNTVAAGNPAQCLGLRRRSAESARPDTGVHTHIWSIGILTGLTPVDWHSPPTLHNPVLTAEDVSDVHALFVADPFMVRHDDRWWMFFEVLNGARNRGEIGLAVSDDGLKWSYQRIVLTEPFHLSYPYVFQWCGDHYLVPETHQTQSVRLYRADAFPFRWRHVATLLTGRPFADSSLCRHADRWWMLTDTSVDHRSDTLRLFYADDLTGRWQEHPCSPVVAGDPTRARPAGRFLVTGSRLLRYAQDCATNYGRAVTAYEITELSPTRYVERPIGPVPMMSGSGSGWTAGGMHHVDPHRLDATRWLACVDGWHGVDHKGRA